MLYVDPNGKQSNIVDKWNRLNNKEKDIVKWDIRFLRAIDIERNAKKATEMTYARFGYNGKGDKSDAYRHAMWQALNTQDTGESFTRKWANAHEYSSPVNELKTDLYMDIHNNDVGIEIGKNNPWANAEELSKIIIERIDKGDMLIISDDQSKLLKSNGKPVKESEIRALETSKKIEREILADPNNQITRDYE